MKTAPGIWLEDARRRWVAMMPGVPREMRGMLSEEVLPKMQRHASGAETVVLSGTLRTTGIAESAIAELLGANFLGAGGSEMGSLPLAFLPGVAGVDWYVAQLRNSAPSYTRTRTGKTTRISPP